MALPIVTFSQGEPNPRRTCKRAEAARILNMSPGRLDKLVKAGYIDLDEANLQALAARPYVTAADGPVLVLQTAVADQIAEPTWRTHTGDSPDLSDEQWLDANRGDWLGFAVGDLPAFALVTLGGFVTGVLQLHDIDQSFAGGKYRFNATIVGRVTRGTMPTLPLVDLASHASTGRYTADGELRDWAWKLLGARTATVIGPHAIWLPAP